jgi:hypothetical protein
MFALTRIYYSSDSNGNGGDSGSGRLTDFVYINLVLHNIKIFRLRPSLLLLTYEYSLYKP